ncbi:MAG: transcriptional repressor [Bradyrhizobium sp.]|jgi:Fur family iron response transcriptional regulator|uniref:Transcriptional repressor n=1 Tax=Bradyrhizobium denitrificans TaxID=2734912 RepID=A0ABS5G7J2_9BRAD|nr:MULTISPECIES: transcriptional repressor [Bradyrhizobium]MBR1137282.1 transcriptional repressor [Bradyrhizobium denitrificans]MDU0957924.1 transcriptional repressor [Bradyrhizobium sp.]MDU1491589.1 transcriptional repressor [Bradyrhizobium sp.]MDU1542297.1 transcriptional repressor [Bradyrhizobium sp.]MDU1668383.1 transcriptional repressor [Bradyrhizobium sp.]
MLLDAQLGSPCNGDGGLCPAADTCEAGETLVRRCEDTLRKAGLRPTQQRQQLSRILFGNGDCHITADALYAAAVASGMKISQATIYNTLNQFVELGLLRQIGVDGSRSFFDTNTTVHPHFFYEDEGVLVDVPEHVAFDQLPEPLPGYGMERIDVIIHLRRRRHA